MFIRVPFVFTRVHSCSVVFIRVALVFTRVHSCSICVHSCSFVFTRVHSCSTRVRSCSFVFHSCSFVFTRVHSCSLVFRSVWCFRYDRHNFVSLRSVRFLRSHDAISAIMLQAVTTDRIVWIGLYQNLPVYGALGLVVTV